MKFAYLTTDEVNGALAVEMGQECGVSVELLDPRDGPAEAGYDAVVCDWDFWPVPERQRFVKELPVGQRLSRALHSYNVDDAQGEQLRRRGVAVFARLQREVFDLLRLTVLLIRRGLPAEQVERPQEGSVQDSCPACSAFRVALEQPG
jgi:hypothetical protein